MVWPRGASVLLPTAHLKHAETPDSLGLLPRSSPRPQKPAAQGVPPLLRHLGTPGGHRPRKNPGTSSHSDTKCCCPFCVSLGPQVGRCGFHSPQGASDLCRLGLRRQLSCGKPVAFWSGRVQCDWQAGWVPLETRKLRGSYCVSSRRTGGHSCLVDFLLSLWKLAQ